MKKRFLAIFLAVIMTATLLPATTLAGSSDFVINENGALTEYNGPGGDVVIPDGVREIGQYSFSGCTGLTSVIIPESVTCINACAFKDCTGLTSITIPKSVALFGSPVFPGCTSLTMIQVDENNQDYTSVDGVLFTKDMKTLTFYPAGARGGAYTIPNGVSKIGFGAFYSCDGLTSVDIPDSVTNIENKAFWGCTNLTAIQVPSDNQSYASVDGVLFSKDQSKLMAYPGGKQGAYTIPDSVTTLFGYPFTGHTGLTSIVIPGSVTSIGYEAFCGCTSLASVTIGSGVTEIDMYAFSGCTSLTSIVIPDSVTRIWGNAFSGSTNLTSVTIGSGVTSIGNSAFSGCTSLTSIVIPDSVTSVEKWAFSRTSLTSIVIPDSVTKLGERVFYDCADLTCVVIPVSVTEIGRYAFENSDKVTVYGQAGSYAEQYCQENNIPFIVGFPSGVAHAGRFENADGSDGPAWAITAEGEVTVDAAALAPDETVFVACCDNNGKFIDVKLLTAEQATAQIDPGTPNVKSFWLNDVSQPQSPSVTVWGK